MIIGAVYQVIVKCTILQLVMIQHVNILVKMIRQLVELLIEIV